MLDPHTTCSENGVCTYTSNVRFVQDNNEYVPIELASSLKNLYTITQIEDDPSLDLEIIDFGYDWIEYCYKADLLQYNKPIKVYRMLNETHERVYYEHNTGWSNLFKKCEIRRDDNGILGTSIKFGENSDILTITSSGTEIDNFGDAYVSENSPNNYYWDYVYLLHEASYPGERRNIIFRFNISSLLEYEILEANLYMYLFFEQLETGDYVTLVPHILPNTVIYNLNEISFNDAYWTHSDSEWAGINNSVTVYETGIHQYHLFNITDGFNNSGNNITVFINATEPEQNAFNDLLYFVAGEHSSQPPPILNITYTLPTGIPDVWTTLSSPDDGNTSVLSNVNFTATLTSENSNLDNASLWHNISGTWELNQTDFLTGTSDTANFSLFDLPDNISFIWNVEGHNDVGNHTFADSNWTVTISLPDTTPPDSVTNFRNTSVTYESITLRWDNSSSLDIWQTILYRNGTNIFNTSSLEYVDSPLNPLYCYNYTAHTKDFNGNVNDTDVSFITCTPTDDTSPPEITIINPPNTTILDWDTPSVTLRITTTVSDSSHCNYSTDDITYTQFSQTGEDDHRQPISLVSNTSYTYFYLCRDEFFNTNTDPQVHTFSVSENFAPNMINNLHNRTSQTNRIYLKWDNYIKPEDFSHFIIYRNSTFLYNLTSGTPFSNEYYFDYNVSDSLCFNYTIYTVDTSENINTTTNIQNTHVACTTFLDYIEPGAANNLINLSTDNNLVELNWTAPSDPDFSYFIVTRNNSFEDINITHTSFNDTSVQPGITYNYTIYTGDTSGNENRSSYSGNTLLVSTPVEDLDPPTVTIISPINNSNLSYTTSSTILNILTDGYAECRYNTFDVNYDSMVPFANTFDSNHSNVTLVSPGNTYEFYYACNDSSNNIANSTYHVFHTNTTPVLTITDVYPIDNFNWSTNDNPVFTYTPNYAAQIPVCILYMNLTTTWSAVDFDIPTENIPNYLFSNNLDPLSYQWFISCLNENSEAINTSVRTLNVLEVDLNLTHFFWLDSDENELMRLDDQGYLTIGVDYAQSTYMSGLHVRGDVLIDGQLIVLNQTGTADLILMGESDREFVVGKMFSHINHTRGGCAGIEITGTYSYTEDGLYFFELDTSGGTEIGQARYRYSDDGTSNWQETDVLTTESFRELTHGVRIRFRPCPSADFNSGDVFEFVAFSDPEDTFIIDTNEPDRAHIWSEADWTFSEGEVYFEDGAYITGDLYVNNISVFNITYAQNEVIWTILFP